MPALSERLRVIAPDMAGFGFSERPAGIQYDLDTWVAQAIGLLDAAGGRADALAVSRVIGVARALAWSSAVELTPLTGRERAAAIAEIDERVAIASRAIAHPGPVMSSILLPIRLMERRSVAEAVDELAKIDG